MTEIIHAETAITDLIPNGFLEGGGEMRTLTRTFNWSETTLGPVETWPLCLRITLGIILNSKFPMFLFWGPQLLCFYNDAYRPSLGNEGKHPEALGKPAEQVWPEIWPQIKPLIDQVLVSGESTWSEDRLLPIYRNGSMENVYWTFSYSPVYDETGNRAGIFITCTETTGKVTAIQKLTESIHQQAIITQQLEESAKNLRNLILQAPVAMCILKGPNQIVEIANDRMLELWGKSGAMLLNKPLFEGLPEASNQGFEELLDSVFYRGETVTAFGLPVLLPRNGTVETVYINFVYEAYKEENGLISGVMVVANEVTKQVLSAEKLQESERRFRQLSESNIIGIVFWDLDGNMKDPNEAFLTMIRCGEEEVDLSKQNLIEITAPEHRHKTIEKLEKVLTGRSTELWETQMLLKNGSSVDAIIGIALLEGSDKEGFAFLIDITDRKRIEKELQFSNLNLTKINTDLDNFIYTASHDLKAPISNLEGLLALFVEEYEFDAEQKPILEMIVHSVERFKTTLIDLTEISKVQREDQEDYQSLLFSDILNEVQLDIRALIVTYHPVITTNFEIAEIHYSRRSLRSIIYNLLSNALKYSSDKRQSEIHLSTKRQNGYVILTISDNGLGLSDSDQIKIFGMFQRAHQHVEGSGIGLYMIKRMIENGGGKIEVESSIDTGTTFSVYLLSE